MHVHQQLTECVLYVCEVLAEVRACEGEGYPAASERKEREGALLHVGGEKMIDDENKRLCSHSAADEELPLAQVAVFHLIARSLYRLIPRGQLLVFISLSTVYFPLPTVINQPFTSVSP